MGPGEKLGWVVVIFALLYVELQAIHKERSEHDREQARARIAEQARSLKQEREFMDLLQQNQQTFSATMSQMRSLIDSGRTLNSTTKKTLAAAQTAVEAITGGDSYPEIIVGSQHPGASTHPAVLFGGVVNTKAVWEFTYQVEEVDDCLLPKKIRRLGNGATGPMLAGTIATLPFTLAPSSEGTSNYRAIMQSKNGQFMQCVDVRFNQKYDIWESQSTILHGTMVIAQIPWPKWP